jgi:hypothetical protein
MKIKYFFMTALVILMLAVIFSNTVKEGFIQHYCQRFTNCTDCSSASGCSWCPKAKVCLTSTTLKSTDTDCNQNNTIASSFLCRSADGIEPPTLPDAIASNDVMYEFSLYKNRITDKIPPPNLYMAGEVKVSNEDLLSNMNDVRNDIKNNRQELPGLIASTVEDQIRPMVRGILGENYYIQGFEDMNPCKKYNNCSGCVNDNKCGWDPNMLSCDTRGPNKSWYITQAPRCVTTTGTKNLMLTQPN